MKSLEEKIDELEDLTEYIQNNYQKHYGFIYLIKDMLNHKYYIGQKKLDDKSRWKTYMGSGYHLLNAQKNYGKEHFIRVIVDYADTLEKLNELESRWIKNFDAVKSDQFYNKIDGGDVVDQLTRRNSIPVINIDSGFVFKSILDAVSWAGHGYGVNTLKESFYKIHVIGQEKKNLIFRPLKHLKEKSTLCILCGTNIRIKGNKKFCEKCKKHDKFNPKECVQSKYDYSMRCFSIKDKWVQDFIQANDVERKLPKRECFLFKNEIVELTLSNKKPTQIKKLLDLNCSSSNIRYYMNLWEEKCS